MRVSVTLKWLLVLFLLLLVLMTGNRKLWQDNLATVKAVQTMYPFATSHLSQLYSIRSDVQLPEEVRSYVAALSTDHNLALTLISAGLNNDYLKMSELATQSWNKCRQSATCRYLAGKAYVRLGQDQRAFDIWLGDELLWSRLIGNTAMTPQTPEEMQFLERYYSILADLAPDNAAPPFMLGSIYRSQGGWQRAIPLFEQAVAREPDNARYLCSFGEVLVITQQDVVRGLALCDAARHLAPNDMWVQEQVARTFAAAGECAVAADIYLQMLSKFATRSEPSIWYKGFWDGKVGRCVGDGTK